MTIRRLENRLDLLERWLYLECISVIDAWTTQVKLVLSREELEQLSDYIGRAGLLALEDPDDPAIVEILAKAHVFDQAAKCFERLKKWWR